MLTKTRVQVCRRWNELLSGQDSILAGQACALRCSGKITSSKAKQLWIMIAHRKPTHVILRNAGFYIRRNMLKLSNSSTCFCTIIYRSVMLTCPNQISFSDKSTCFFISWINISAPSDPVALQLLLKHHPSLSCLTVSTTPKHLKKTIRTIRLFTKIQQLELHVKGGSQVSL